MIIELPEPHINQREILKSKSRFNVLMCGRRFGKSELAQIILIKNALEGKKCAYVTPNYKLAKKFFDSLMNALPDEVGEFNKTDLEGKLITGGEIQFFTGERLDNFRSLKFHLAIIDEGSFIPDLEDGWNNAIRATLADYKGKAYFLSTPRGKNFFYSLYLKGINGEPDWASWKYTSYDNPYLDQNEIELIKESLPAAVFEQEYMANPAENAANPFGTEYINRCIEPISNHPVVCYGIDLAKSSDFTVIIGLDKYGSVCYFDRFQRDWRHTIKEIQQLPNIAKVKSLIDSTGVGDPVVEDLQTTLPLVEGFKFSSSSKQQLMEGLVKAIQKREITFPAGPITNELHTFEYSFHNSITRYSAPPMFNDDCVMALALAVKCFGTGKAVGSGRYSISWF
ncbi:terminase large subunit domain-containing protein [Pollutibacter soli]|uniref:terminase large subunit domain-containing protein n=1 Tax=Pollutibacter soli TaxID=3034157 RepID=UPI00301339CA